MDPFGLLSVLIFVLLLAIMLLASAIFIVHTQQVAVIERLGKFVKVATPGLNFKVPLIDRVAARLNMQVQQLIVEVETKTKDNVFVSIPVAVQFQVIPGRERDAHYALQQPIAQINSYVQDNVRTSLASLTLDQAFESKDSIAAHVEATLSDRMGTYGWAIVNTLVTDIRPDTRVMNSMNEINAAQRQRDAAVSLAEAEKIRLVTTAEGEAEAKRLQGMGIAMEREAIVEGLAEQIKTLQEAGVETSPEQLLLLTQYFDTLRDVARNSRSSVMFVPSNPGGVAQLSDEITKAYLAASQLDQGQQQAGGAQMRQVANQQRYEITER